MRPSGIIVPLFALLCGPSIPAQENQDPAVAQAATRDTTGYYSSLNENAPRHVNINNVPRFAVFGKEDKFYLGLGANITLVGEYDFGNPVSDANFFTTSAIPMTIPGGNGAKMRFTAQQSGIYLNVVALPGSDHKIGAYVAFNFLNDNYSPYLQHAYLKFHDITAGYTYTLFSDVAAAPALIDYEGPNAMATIPHALIAYEPYIGKNRGWRLGVALEMPEDSYTDAAHTVAVSQRFPDIPFYVQKLWASGNGWVRVAGIVRNLYYRNTLAAHNIDKVGWGIHASGKIPVTSSFSASFSAIYGEGIASYIQDLNGEGMDLMPSGTGTDRLKAVKAWAGYGSLTYQFTPRLFSTATYSHVRAYAPRYSSATADTPWGASYSYAQYLAVNTFYQFNKIAQLGVEYLYGRRVDRSGAQAHDNRVECMLRVSF